jgi:hypothetical protein
VRVVGAPALLHHPTPRSTTPSMSEAARKDKCGFKRGDKSLFFAREAAITAGIARGLLLPPQCEVRSTPPSLPKCSSLFDHFIGEHEQVWRKLQAKRRCGFRIDNKLDLGGLLDWQLGRLLSLEDTTGVPSNQFECLR